MTERSAAYLDFRLNFEQQQKRAKDLLKAARAGEPAALARFQSAPQLAEAQYLIARDLRFENWAALKRHIALMADERRAIEAGSTPPTPTSLGLALDGQARTLHIRCGSDLQVSLELAGFTGEFYEHSYPYLAGPISDAPGCLEGRTQFLVRRYDQFLISRYNTADPSLLYDRVLEDLRRNEQQLLDSAQYERIAIWSEHDCYDQLVLVRLLDHYATHQRPPLIELINVGQFPGATRFIGLGQLPPEALRMLWKTRQPAGLAELEMGRNAWRALTSPDPCALATIMRSATPTLPLLSPALHRHLRELPSVANGLSLTEEMTLSLLATQPQNLSDMFARMTYSIDPLPGQGDLQVRDRVLDMEQARERVFTRAPDIDRNGHSRPPWTDVFTITDLGRAVLHGEVDFRSLDPPPRWVGGVEIGAGRPDWRWDERIADALLR